MAKQTEQTNALVCDENEINPNALYWASFNGFELRLPGRCVIDCSHSGSCDDDVAYWTPKVREQVEKDAFPLRPTAELIRAELSDHGAWDDEELSDDAANWCRLVWIAANDIAEDESRDCSEPVR